MHTTQVLLLTDLVDSTRLAERLGDDEAAKVWQAHDRIARDLLRRFNGRELDRSDGYLWLFDRVEDAVAHALAYQRALRDIDPPLTARAGLHAGALVMRANSADDVALGAKPIEFEGLAKVTAARIMALAQGGQTLLSAEARALLGRGDWRVDSHGHWRLKGLAEPVELFEVGADDGAFVPPPDAAKAYRVTRTGDGWTPMRHLPHNLPAERDPFFGRRQDLLDLARRIDEGARLVSLLGIGGIGKTRLALRFARHWLGDFAGGAWFCDLSAARSLDGIVHAVAQALDVPLGKADPVQQLGAAIAGRGPCLVVLDNFEQVARHAEATLGHWLDRAPEARFVVTSRELLGISGEQALALAPLTSDEAVQLFEQRMLAGGAKAPPIAADRVDDRADERAAIGALVELLDRLPLAIELAAARSGVMPPRQLLQRMGERFKLLASQGGRHDRQATLRATLDWSWDLLTAAEQSAIAQLSVFEGGFTLAAAEAVLDLSTTTDAPWVVDVVQSLLQKSLLRQVRDGRFDMLRSVQDYAAERLAAGRAGSGNASESHGTALSRHWRYFAAMDEAAATVDRCVEVENAVAACRRATMAGDSAAAAGALVAAWSSLRLTGPYATGLVLIDGVRGCGNLGPHSESVVQWIHGRVLHALGRSNEARKYLDAAVVLAESSGDALLAARTLLASGEQRLSGSDHPAARAELERCRALASRAGHGRLECRAANALGVLDAGLGRTAAARQHYENALTVARQVGDLHQAGGTLGNLGELLQNCGQLDQAAECYVDALAQVSAIGDRRWEGNIRCNHGLLLMQQGLADAARPQFESALRIAREIGHGRLEATVLCNLGIAEHQTGDFGSARSSLEAAVAMAQAAGDDHSEGQFLTYLGATLASIGDFALARTTLAAAEPKLRQADDPVGLALMLTEDALLACQLGEWRRARRLQLEAEALFTPLAMTGDAELARALARLRTVLARPPMP